MPSSFHPAAARQLAARNIAARNIAARNIGARLLAPILLILSASLAGCAAGPVLPTEAAPATVSMESADAYRLEPGNKVRVQVFNQTNLSGDFTLDPAGNISMPLIGNIPSAGITSRVLGERIADQLKRDNYMQDPRVGVEVVTFRPFYVLGEVRQPGEFPYMTGMTVLSAIARAGGYDYRARQGEVVVVRMIGSEQKDYLANERTPLLPGDIVRVLERRF